MTSPLLTLFTFLSFTFTTSAFAGAEREVSARFKRNGYHCTDAPGGGGIYCVGGTPANHVVIPRGVDRFLRQVFYAHGLVGVCGNGASGERYLKFESPTLQKLKAVAVMPWRQAANNAGFPLGNFVEKMDGIIGSTFSLALAGHSAAGPFFATTLNGTGSKLVPRVEKVLLLDAIYGEQADRWLRVFARKPAMKLKILSTTTAGKSRPLANRLQQKYPRNVILDIKKGDHCSVPMNYFKDLASF